MPKPPYHAEKRVIRRFFMLSADILCNVLPLNLYKLNVPML